MGGGFRKSRYRGTTAEQIAEEARADGARKREAEDEVARIAERVREMHRVALDKLAEM